MHIAHTHVSSKLKTGKLYTYYVYWYTFVLVTYMYTKYLCGHPHSSLILRRWLNNQNREGICKLCTQDKDTKYVSFENYPLRPFYYSECDHCLFASSVSRYYYYGVQVFAVWQNRKCKIFYWSDIKKVQRIINNSNKISSETWKRSITAILMR